jgi:hypothetical protein
MATSDEPADRKPEYRDASPLCSTRLPVASPDSSGSAASGWLTAEPGAGQAGDGGGSGDGPELGRCGGQGLVLAVGEVDVGGGGVPFELLDAGCARDRGHRGVADDPGQGNLRRGRRVRVGYLAEGFDESGGALEVAGKEQRVGGADPVRPPVSRSYRPESSPWASGL